MPHITVWELIYGRGGFDDSVACFLPHYLNYHFLPQVPLVTTDVAYLYAYIHIAMLGTAKNTVKVK